MMLFWENKIVDRIPSTLPPPNVSVWLHYPPPPSPLAGIMHYCPPTEPTVPTPLPTIAPLQLLIPLAPWTSSQSLPHSQISSFGGQGQKDAQATCECSLNPELLPHSSYGLVSTFRKAGLLRGAVMAIAIACSFQTFCPDYGALASPLPHLPLG